MLLTISCVYVYTHWQETRELITWTVELWKGGLDCHGITTEYRTLVYVYTHWPDTCEFITQTVEFWNRWIRLSCIELSIDHVSIVYTCNTCFVKHWSM